MLDLLLLASRKKKSFEDNDTGKSYIRETDSMGLLKNDAPKTLQDNILFAIILTFIGLF